MAIEEVNHQNGVHHIKETQREHRTRRGRFVPPSTLGDIAKSLISQRTQREVAEEIGIVQPEISRAVNNANLTVALKIIEHYAPDEIEGPLYFVPQSIDEKAHEEAKSPQQPTEKKRP